MGLRDLFSRKRFVPATKMDAYLGAVESDRYGYWTGSCTFRPVGRKIDFALKAGADGPSDAQRSFLKQIEERYPALAAELRETMFEDVAPWPDGTTATQIFDSLELRAISINSGEQPPFEWEMTMITPLDDHVFTVHVRDWQYEGYGMDG